MKLRNPKCEICGDKGWIETSVYFSSRIADGTLVVEKCDTCNIFNNDASAATFAFENYQVSSFKNAEGINVRIDFPII